MKNRLKELGESRAWRLMVNAALRAMEGQGYKLTRMPGRGLSNIWRMEKGGKVEVVAIRTTRDRWIAFPPLEGGKKWKTLDDVQHVLVAVVDSRDDPQAVDVHLIPADVVRQRFNASYKARVNNGHNMIDNYGMWVKLDAGNPGVVSESGAGLALDYPAIASYSLDDLLSDVPKLVADLTTEEAEAAADEEKVETAVPAPVTVAEVLSWARDHISRLTGVKPGAIKLDLKIEY